MPNQFLTINMITNEASMVLENMLSFSKYVDRQYDDRFANSGAKIGDTLRLRKPPRYVGRSGAALSVEDSIDTSVNLTVGPNATSWFQNGEQFGVDITFTTADLTLSMDDFSNRYIKPAMARIANRIDEKGMDLARAVANLVGTPGTTPATALAWLQAGARLDDNAALRDNQRYAIMNPDAQAATVDGLKGLFQQSELIGEQYSMGAMGRALGYTFAMDQNVIAHTVGPLGGTPLVNGAGQGAASTTSDPFTSTTNLVTDGWTAAAATRLRRGDVFTIGTVANGCLGVNPQSKASTGKLQQFVVTADASSDVSGNLTAVISPAIITAGPMQTVTQAPPDNAAITVVGTANTAYPQNLAFHKSAFCLATADLELPRGVDMAARNTYKGISIRAVRQYAIATDTLPTRLDVFYGWCAFQPQLACRITG
jgi:hypothetical protein